MKKLLLLSLLIALNSFLASDEEVKSELPETNKEIVITTESTESQVLTEVI